MINLFLVALNQKHYIKQKSIEIHVLLEVYHAMRKFNTWTRKINVLEEVIHTIKMSNKLEFVKNDIL